MNHGIKQRKLGMKTEHRLCFLRNACTSLFTHGRIKTTAAKAKEIRPVAEKLITLAKRSGNDLAAKRKLASYLYTEESFKTLVNTIAPAMKERNGGYTRILKSGFRHGDNAPVSYIELVDVYEKIATENLIARQSAEAEAATEAQGAEESAAA